MQRHANPRFGLVLGQYAEQPDLAQNFRFLREECLLGIQHRYVCPSAVLRWRVLWKGSPTPAEAKLTRPFTVFSFLVFRSPLGVFAL